MRITSKGQVTIPRTIREKAGFLPHTEVEFVFDHGSVHLVKSAGGKSRGANIIDHLKGRADTGMTTGEIMDLTREP